MITPTTDNLEVKNESLANARDKRTQAWLEQQLETIWLNHFSDVARLNTVTIKWSRINRTRLGTITAKGGHDIRNNPELSEIRINPLLQHPEVPQSVIWQTIAHELAHYTHGFCSPHPRRFRDPHRGGVVKNELIERKLGDIYLESEKWLRNNWTMHVTSQINTKPRRRRYARRKPVSLLSHLKKAITG